MPETGTDAKSSLRKCIGLESNSLWACAKGEIAALIVAVIETPLYSACLAQLQLPTLCSKAFEAARFSRETSATLREITRRAFSIKYFSVLNCMVVSTTGAPFRTASIADES